MKYIYTICLALSSFFAYNIPLADTNTHLNAFFIPGGAFQQNTEVKSIEPSLPRQLKTTTQAATQQQNTQKTLPTSTSPANTTTHQAKNSQITKKVTTSPKTQTIQNTPPLTTKTQTAKAPNTKKQISHTPKQAKYKLDDFPTEQTVAKSTAEQDITSLEKFQQKNLKEMLDSLPYPDFKLPKYKQIYALYTLELRSASRRGKLPANYEQEETLAKANSVRRFSVK